MEVNPGKKLIVLGTASQVPTRLRNQTGFFLKWNSRGFVFDPGEGFQRQMVHYSVSASEITKIFITHFHGDHCLGLPGIVQRISLDKVKHTVEIYYPASGQEYYERLTQASIFFNQAKLKPCPIFSEGIVFEDKSLLIHAIPLEHPVNVLGYRIREKDSVTMLPQKLAAKKIEGSNIKTLKEKGEIRIHGQTIYVSQVSVPKAGWSMAFIMDTRFCRNAIKLARDVDLLVCEATYLSEDKQTAEKHGHLTAAQAATIAKEARSGKVVLSHFSQRYRDTDAFLTEAASIHPNVVVVTDGDTVALPEKKRYSEHRLS